eukprot:Nitzschia sp. Nitz4//scaffold49_size126201//116812//118450//NITZ4_003662-RA/size126201-exonerate_est2genome-gene-0.44-mRNA-1//1//CDS//3329553209//3447//frame0
MIATVATVPKLPLLDKNSASKTQDATSNQMFGGSLLSQGVDYDEGASLAQELNKLSLKEREQVLYDLHGVADGNNERESPESVQQALSSFSSLLSAELANPNTAEILRTAGVHAQDRLTDPAFQLLFLRADDFDIRRAFNRMICYLEEVRFLFGNEQLSRRITLHDLNSEDRQILDLGFCQILPAKDRSGRSVLFASIPHTTENVETIPLLRSSWYLLLSHLENDEDAQKNGIVLVLSYIGMKANVWSPTLAWQAHKFVEALPVRIVANHGLIETREFGYFLRFRKLWEQRRRLRSRAHYGTYLECMYALMTFGIPTKYIPLTADGEIHTKHHREWIRQSEIRELQEKRQSPSAVNLSSPANNLDSTEFPTTPKPLHETSEMLPFLSTDLCDQISTIPVNNTRTVGDNDGVTGQAVIVPARNDVLFGRGRPIQEHHGNVVFNNLLDAVRDRYDGLRRSEKTALTLTIVSKIKRAGGRFLRPDPSNPELWEEVDDEAARIKVSHTFRSLRQLHKHKEPALQF